MPVPLDRPAEKTMQSADAELRRRRDRGKAAQRAFRIRQAQSAQKLKDDHEKLRRLVTDIVDAARVDDGAQLAAAITQAGKSIGLELEIPLASNHAKILETSTRQSSSGSEQSQVIKTISPNPPSTFSHIPEDLVDSVAHYQSGRSSPRLDYGLWLDPDRFLKIFDAPIDIVPYIGPGRYTIAGQIMWACLELGQAVIKEATTNKTSTLSTETCESKEWYPSVLSPRSQVARRMFDLTLRHSKALHDVAYMGAMLEARMDFQRLGYMRADNVGADEASRELLEVQVLQDLKRRGVRMEEWWTALEIENFLRQRMGMARFSAFQGALIAQASSQTELLMPLARSLAQRAVCFGRGPRWKADQAATLASAWVSLALECEGDARYAYTVE